MATYCAKPRDLALFTKLVRLAAGDTQVVYQALSQTGRGTVPLTEVVRYIETHRAKAPVGEPKQEAMDSLGAIGSATRAG